MSDPRPIQYAGLPSPAPWCAWHEFTPATHTSRLMGQVMDLCPKCAGWYGGTAFTEQPRPFYAGELEHRAAMIRLDRRINNMARAALARIERPTPTEVAEVLAELPHIIDAYHRWIGDTMTELGRQVMEAGQMYNDTWLGVLAAFDEGNTDEEHV